MKNQQLATAKPPSAALAVAQPSSPKEASVTKPSDLQRVGRLLEAFDASALGEGDLAAGANVLATMAISLANVQRPGTCLMTTDGAGLAVGTSLLVSGSHSSSLVGERVLSGLADRQNNLASHLREWCRSSEIEMAKSPNVRTFNPVEILEAGTSPALLDLHKDARMSGLLDLKLCDALMYPPGGQGKRDLHNRPLVYVTAGKPAVLAKNLEHSHLGRAYVHLAIHDAAACSRFEECCTAVMDGSLAVGPLSETIRGSVIATDPFETLNEIVRTGGGKAASWPTRTLWLTDSAAGPEPGEFTAAKTTVKLDRIQARYNAAMDTAWVGRLDYQDTASKDEQCDWQLMQAKWITFLKSMEAELPGITGTARPLLATLVFGFRKLMRIAKPAAGFEWFQADIAAFARWLVRRMANARAAMLHTEHLARLQRLGASMIHKLVGRAPMTVRELTRVFSRLSAGECHDVLFHLQAQGAVTCFNQKWCLASPASNPLQPLTLNV